MTCCFFPLALGSGFMDGVFGWSRGWVTVRGGGYSLFFFDKSRVSSVHSPFFLASCAVQGLQ